MAHYALIDENNIVVSVITGRNESEIVDGISDWEEYYGNIHKLTCLRTSYNTRGGVHYDQQTKMQSEDQSKAFRFNYAGVGFSYDSERDAFIPPKPYESWILNESTCLWDPPVPMPDDGQNYIWDEETISWVVKQNN